MVISQGKDGVSKMLVYRESVLTLEKDDSLTFTINNEHLQYTIKFTFSTEGEKYSTTYWEAKDGNYLHIELHNWDGNTYVEVTKPIEINVPLGDSKVWMKFRNYSNVNKNHRKFDLSVWKEVKGGE